MTIITAVASKGCSVGSRCPATFACPVCSAARVGYVYVTGSRDERPWRIRPEHLAWIGSKVFSETVPDPQPDGSVPGRGVRRRVTALGVLTFGEALLVAESPEEVLARLELARQELTPLPNTE